MEREIHNTEIQKACDLVERRLRSLGPNCQVIFTDDGVEIAPLADAGSTTGTTLFDALQNTKTV